MIFYHCSMITYSAFLIFYFKQNKHPPISIKNVNNGTIIKAAVSELLIENH